MFGDFVSVAGRFGCLADRCPEVTCCDSSFGSAYCVAGVSVLLVAEWAQDCDAFLGDADYFGERGFCRCDVFSLGHLVMYLSRVRE